MPSKEEIIKNIKLLIEERKVFIDDLFDKDDILNHVNGEYKPEDVFHEIALEIWALGHGFSKR